MGSDRAETGAPTPNGPKGGPPGSKMSSINVNYGKILQISKQIVNFDMLYAVF